MAATSVLLEGIANPTKKAAWTLSGLVAKCDADRSVRFLAAFFVADCSRGKSLRFGSVNIALKARIFSKNTTGVAMSRLSTLCVLIIALATASLFVSPASAVNYYVTQVTDDGLYKSELEISNGNLAWVGIVDPWAYNSDVFFYDGWAVTELTPGDLTGHELDLSDDNVVWSGWDGDLNDFDDEVFYFDGATTTQVSFNTYEDLRVRVSGNNAVWEGETPNGSEIFLYDTSATTQLTNNTIGDHHPEVSGDHVVWATLDENEDWQISSYDGTTTTQLTSDNGLIDAHPRVSGDNVAWYHNDGNDWEVMLHDGTTTTQVTNTTEDDRVYDISGDNIVWRQGPDATGQVFFSDGVTTTQLSTTSAAGYPQVSGDNVVWQGWDGTDWEIFLYDGVTTTQLTDNDRYDGGPVVSGDDIAWLGATAEYTEVFMATPDLIICLLGDANCDGCLDIGGDILPAFTNFTGPGSFGKTRAQGDVHGPAVPTATGDPHDGDVDVSDLLTMFGNFTGGCLILDECVAGQEMAAAHGLEAPAEAGDSNVPDLIYDPVTGEVILDVDGSGIIGYVLKNGSNSFAFGNHAQMLAGVKTSVAGELSEAAFASSVGANSIGNVFPLGMDLAALSAYLTVNNVSRFLGADVVPFDLVVLGPAVPEPSTYVLAAIGLLGLAMLGRRRRQA